MIDVSFALHGASITSVVVMLVTASVSNPPDFSPDFDTRIRGYDEGLINAWLVGLRKRTEDPEMAKRAMAGELPPMPFKGGVVKAIKSKDKVGALWYLAAWQGLRGEDLCLDTRQETTLVCSRTGVPVTYTSDIAKLFSTAAQEE